MQVKKAEYPETKRNEKVLIVFIIFHERNNVIRSSQVRAKSEFVSVELWS